MIEFLHLVHISFVIFLKMEYRKIDGDDDNDELQLFYVACVMCASQTTCLQWFIIQCKLFDYKETFGKTKVAEIATQVQFEI